jgi:hypothetical protein
MNGQGEKTMACSTEETGMVYTPNFVTASCCSLYARVTYDCGVVVRRRGSEKSVHTGWVACRMLTVPRAMRDWSERDIAGLNEAIQVAMDEAGWKQWRDKNGSLPPVYAGSESEALYRLAAVAYRYGCKPPKAASLVR